MGGSFGSRSVGRAEEVIPLGGSRKGFVSWRELVAAYERRDEDTTGFAMRPQATGFSRIGLLPAKGCEVPMPSSS